MKHYSLSLALPLSIFLTTLTSINVAAAPIIGSEQIQNEASSLTIYNNGQGLIRQTVEVDLPLGQSELNAFELSNMAIPTSILLRSLTAPDAIHILEQSYHAPQLASSQLLTHQIGQPIQFTTSTLENNTTVSSVRTGTLLSTQGGIVVAFEEGITINPEGEMSFPNQAEPFSPYPTVSWQLDNHQTEAHTLEVSYLSYGLDWKANYVALLSPDNTELELTAWVSLSNNSHLNFEDAAIKLIAGQPNQAPVYSPMMMRDIPEQANISAEANIETSSLSIYQIYTLSEPTSLAPFESKQVNLFQKTGVSVKPNYTLTSFIQDNSSANLRHLTAEIQLDNTQVNQLALPMPAGTINFYQTDQDDLLQWMGQDNIFHTPVNESIKLNIGEAFDVVANRNQTEFNQINEDTAEVSYQIEVRNHKEIPIKATLIEKLPSQVDWTIISENTPSEQPDANTLHYSIEVPANDNVQVIYTVQMKIKM